MRISKVGQYLNIDNFQFFSTAVKMAQGYHAKHNLQIKFFKLDSWWPGAGFYPIGTIN